MIISFGIVLSITTIFIFSEFPLFHVAWVYWEHLENCSPSVVILFLLLLVPSLLLHFPVRKIKIKKIIYKTCQGEMYIKAMTLCQSELLLVKSRVNHKKTNYKF